jgi:SAM-dependent methyltransferase
VSAEAEAAKGEEYYRENCGGAEFFARYGAAVLKPALALALKRADARPGMTALDMGCGRGELLRHLKEAGVEAVGADYAPAALGLAKKTSEAPVLRADARKLPFRDASFDRIFFVGVVDHLPDPDLGAAFREFRRVLRPDGFVLLSSCVNTDYYKVRTYALRKTAARLLGLKEPRPPRSSEDEDLHINEHNESGLARFLDAEGWDHEIEPRPNDKFALDELYGPQRPADFPLKSPAPWKRLWHAAAFRGPLKSLLARELFCRARPKKR